MIKVGLTGGIGSGKTTIAKAFAAVGVPVYNCDDAAHMLTDIIERRRNRPLDRFFFKYSLRSNLFLFGKIQ